MVAPDVVLTAAHCIGVKWAEWGRDFKERNGQKRHTRRVVDFVSHPDFYYDLFENDVALIKLDMPFDEVSPMPPQLLTKLRGQAAAYRVWTAPSL